MATSSEAPSSTVMRTFVSCLFGLTVALAVGCTTNAGDPVEAPPAATATPDESPTSAVTPTAQPTSSPVATPAPGALAEWTIGEPVPLPDGLTLVLGTGCWQCGGQHTTYELFDKDGRAVLRDVPDEVHIAGDFRDPERISLAACTSANDCAIETEDPGGLRTTLYESLDHGVSWSSVATTTTMYTILGRTSDEQVLVRRYIPPPADLVSLPSGTWVEPPSAAAPDRLPFVIGGHALWLTADHALTDGAGTVILNVSAVLPERADIQNVVHHPEGGYAVTWLDDRAWGIAIVREDVVRAYDVTGLGSADFIWLDDRRLIASIQYRTETLRELGLDRRLSGSRTPSIVDLDTETVHPIEEFLEDGAPRGRNYVHGVWWE